VGSWGRTTGGVPTVGRRVSRHGVHTLSFHRRSDFQARFSLADFALLEALKRHELYLPIVDSAAATVKSFSQRFFFRSTNDYELETWPPEVFVKLKCIRRLDDAISAYGRSLTPAVLGSWLRTSRDSIYQRTRTCRVDC
jgi:hypothetical protein